MRIDRQTPGFTLLELMIVVAILGIVASIAVPQYTSALRTARVGKARHELVTISHAIDAYCARHAGQLPLTLHQVGFGGKRDPWGTPYCYLNYADGTGDGLEWAILAGLVSPSAFVSGGGGGGDGGSGADPRSHLQAPESELHVGGGAPRDNAASIASAVPRVLSPLETDSLKDSIARSPGFAMFVGVESEQTRRRDRYLFPLNTDYDLFSLGADGRTAVSLGEQIGLDDVIRANNGGFFGLASEY